MANHGHPWARVPKWAGAEVEESPEGTLSHQHRGLRYAGQEVTRSIRWLHCLALSFCSMSPLGECPNPKFPAALVS